jgi:NTP pyrophosphatase (non-canonical NTP hydrolase)
MTDFAVLQKRVGEINIANGWREAGLALPGTRERFHQDIVELALIDTEVAEAIEEIRNGAPDKYYSGGYISDFIDGVEYPIVDDDEALDADGAPRKPEGIRSELADVVIRAMDMADKRGWDLCSDIEEKLAYNSTRGYRHGGKTA